MSEPVRSEIHHGCLAIDTAGKKLRITCDCGWQSLWWADYRSVIDDLVAHTSATRDSGALPDPCPSCVLLTQDRDKALGQADADRQLAHRWEEESEEHSARRGHLATELAATEARCNQLEQERNEVGWGTKYAQSAAEERCVQLETALRDEIAMNEQSVETLRDLHDNWRRIIEEQDPDGGPLIENILFWLIEDVSPTHARAALEEPPEVPETLPPRADGRYPDCWGDCGDNGVYCCDGLWDARKRAALGESK